MIRHQMAVSVRGLTVPRGGVRVLQRITLQLPAGALAAVVGANGTGKTTLLEAMAGLHRFAEGSITLGVARDRIALLAQRHGLDLDVPCSVREFVALGAWPRIGAFRAVSAQEHARISRALEQLGLLPLADRLIETLSPGELQRARFAQTVVRDAQLILLDEPFSSLDESITRDLMQQVGRWHAERRTVIVVLHDLAQVRAHFPTVVTLWKTGCSVAAPLAAMAPRVRAAA